MVSNAHIADAPARAAESVDTFRADAARLKWRALWWTVALTLGAYAVFGGRADVALGCLVGGLASTLKLHLSTAALVRFAVRGGRAGAKALLVKRLGVYAVMALALFAAFRYEAIHAGAACAALFMSNAVVIVDEVMRRRTAGEGASA